jgi:RNA polymerase sigma-70 factor (ECF subfamily)
VPKPLSAHGHAPSPSQVALDAQIAAFLDDGHVEDAATATLRQLGPEVLQYLRAVVRDLDDADDAFSRFAEGVWSGIGAFRRECSIKAWAYRLAWHAALRVLQDPYRRRRDRLQTSVASRLAAQIRTLGSVERDQRVADRIERLRRELLPDEQTMIILRFDRSLSWREVARVLQADGAPVDEAAVRKRFERLKKQLRQRAVAEGLVG